MDPAWRPPAPCVVGDSVKDIDTPALVVDLDRIEYNLKAMGKLMEKYPGVAVRPHIKAHKCPALAAMQVR